MSITSITQVNHDDKTLLIRLDINVTFINGKISDDKRLRDAADTIKTLRTERNKIVILAHMGRPKGKPNAALSLRHIRKPFEDLLGTSIFFLETPLAENAPEILQDLPKGSVVLVENLRFFPEEEQNNTVFAQRLARLGDMYVNDAFSVSHRAHASSHAIAQYLPPYSGPSLDKELIAMDQVIEQTKGTKTLLIGGAKVSTKIGIIKQLAQKFDHMIIGGAMANTFLYADGFPVGKSLYERDAKPMVEEIRTLAKQYQCTLHTPKDIVVCYSTDFNNTKHDIFPAYACPEDGIIIDSAQETIASYIDVLGKSESVLWNGPLGAFEYPPFDHATNQVAHFVAEQTKDNKCVSLAGGGDTFAALKNAKAINGFTHVSSAGGAFLEWLEGSPLPGLEVLDR